MADDNGGGTKRTKISGGAVGKGLHITISGAALTAALVAILGGNVSVLGGGTEISAIKQDVRANGVEVKANTNKIHVLEIDAATTKADISYIKQTCSRLETLLAEIARNGRNHP